MDVVKTTKKRVRKDVITPKKSTLRTVNVEIELADFDFLKTFAMSSGIYSIRSAVRFAVKSFIKQQKVG